MLSHAQERFSFTKRLVSSTLLQGGMFPLQSKTFPEAALQTTVEANPLPTKAKLLICPSSMKMRSSKACSDEVALLQFFFYQQQSTGYIHRDGQSSEDTCNHTHDCCFSRIVLFNIEKD